MLYRGHSATTPLVDNFWEQRTTKTHFSLFRDLHAALAMIERAGPIPPPPLIAVEGLDFSLPVIFRKTGK